PGRQGLVLVRRHVQRLQAALEGLLRGGARGDVPRHRGARVPGGRLAADGGAESPRNNFPVGYSRRRVRSNDGGPAVIRDPAGGRVPILSASRDSGLSPHSPLGDRLAPSAARCRATRAARWHTRCWTLVSPPMSSLTAFQPTSERRVLLVSPRYASSFGTFNHAYPLMGDVRACMPPQGILVIAGLVPARWPVRLVDENVRPVAREDLAWADAVLISGMHVQRAQIHDVARRAREAGRVTVLGGPSVSAAPQPYPPLDPLHPAAAA